jgi:hypothetical protein
MSQLPELPPIPRHTRPVPAHGVQAAISVGRSRRNRVVGVAGGTVTASAVVLALLATTPGSSRESLQPADRQPPVGGAAAPTRTAPPTPQPAAAAARAGAAQQAAAAAAGRRSAGVLPTKSPTPTTSPARRAPGRADFRENPQDQAAPQFCRQPPSGHVGPVYSGGGSACAVSSGGASSVERGETVTATISYCVSHGGAPVVLGYRTGQEHEVVVADSRGAGVFRFSDTVRYVQGAHRRTVGDGRCLQWTAKWDTRYSDGRLVPAGSYTMTVSLAPDTVNGEAGGGGGSTTFSVDVH